MIEAIGTEIKEGRKVICRQIGGYRQICIDEKSEAYTKAREKMGASSYNYRTDQAVIELESGISASQIGLKLMTILQQEGDTTLFCRCDLEERFRLLLDTSGKLFLKEPKEVFEYWGGVQNCGTYFKVIYSPPRLEMQDGIKGTLTALITFLGSPQVFGQAPGEEPRLIKRIKDTFAEYNLDIIDHFFYEKNSANLRDFLKI